MESMAPVQWCPCARGQMDGKIRRDVARLRGCDTDREKLRFIPVVLSRAHDDAGSMLIVLHTDCRGPAVSESAPKSTAPTLTVPGWLKGQKAIVTGANSGIGRGVALALGEAGADVAVNYIVDDDAAQAVVEQLQGFGVKAIKVKADVSDEDQVAAMFKQTIAAFGTVDILVANAGLQRDSAFKEMTLAE